MRVGEAIALDRSDCNLDDGWLLIRRAKFGKSREIPLHPTTQAALRGYERKRDALYPQSRSDSLFVSLAGTRLFYKNVHATYLRLLCRAGLGDRKPRPRIHDLRHSFAVKTLLRWYRDELDVEARLPRLSTYLGHVDPVSTYWYLSATPELLGLAVRRLEVAMAKTS